MPAVPPCGLRCRIAKTHEFLKQNKKPFIVYSIFYLLGIEVLSYFIRNLSNYACYWYPLLTQTGYLLIIFSVFLWSERLHFCFRKNIAVLLLSIYYLFGVISILFQFSNLFYAEVISFILLICSLLVLFLSIFKEI